jgi:hypothetical protein
MRGVKALVLTVVGLAVPLLAHAAAQRLARAGSADVSFVAIGPGGIKMVGRTNELTVRDDGEQIVASVPLKTFDTGIALRDEHLRRALEVDKYPLTELTVARGSIRIPAPGAETSGEAWGTLKLHGRDKKIRFEYQARRDGGTVKVLAKLRVDMREFAIEEIKYMGLKVKPEVPIAVAFGLTEN